MHSQHFNRGPKNTETTQLRHAFAKCPLNVDLEKNDHSVFRKITFYPTRSKVLKSLNTAF